MAQAVASHITRRAALAGAAVLAVPAGAAGNPLPPLRPSDFMRAAMARYEEAHAAVLAGSPIDEEAFARLSDAEHAAYMRLGIGAPRDLRAIRDLADFVSGVTRRDFAHETVERTPLVAVLWLIARSAEHLMYRYEGA